ncbi:molybdenum cofactor guanylyltransferase [Romboutsia sp.]|uniref:molybdenum cofactor guanylyltransferase n=1 Tax=Romboutsia sp. TaxID=1965302 RepID=UPI002C24A43F|nr:molybdenum cofactor guanylyltransferase [Romboutsia sp.]HSQ87578.1 molybdenum cofactor guanylyltransferase [Romboutsia sp.]
MDNFKSAVILAGGKSSRMEFDKQCLFINKKRLIFEVARKLEKHFDDITIVTNKKEYYKDCKYNLVSDEMKNMGPLAGISVGLKQSLSNYVYIIACDMPNIDDRYIRYMKNKIKKDIKSKKTFDIYIPKVNNRIQLFQGFYKKELEHEINEYLLYSSKRSIISFFDRTNKKVSYIDEREFKEHKFRNDMFINLNTKEDLNIYEKGI